VEEDQKTKQKNEEERELQRRKEETGQEGTFGL